MKGSRERHKGEGMKNFFIVMNPDKEGAKETAGEIKHFLEARGARCLIGNSGKHETVLEGKKKNQGDCSDTRRNDSHYTDASMVPEDTECIITLGGDGTLIQAARDLAGRNIPMLGINRGTLGYLTQISKQEDIETNLLALLNDEYQLEEIMMLQGRAYRGGQRRDGRETASQSEQSGASGQHSCPAYEDIALNEIVLTRNERLKMLHFRVYVNGQFSNEYRADGLIAATPTGSTAYNLSAGGPIIVPDSRMMVLTPICSHALNARSIVMSADDKIRIEILGTEETSQSAVFDGDTAVDLYTGDYIEIHRSDIRTVLLKLKEVSFLDNLRNKMEGI